jgi:hypothetical protein
MTLLTRWIVAASLLLLAGFAAWLYPFVRALVQGRRRFQFKPNLRRGSGWSRLLGLLLALLVAAAWFALGLLIVGSLFPLQAGLVGLALLAWLLALALVSVTVKVEGEQR